MTSFMTPAEIAAAEQALLEDIRNGTDLGVDSDAEISERMAGQLERARSSYGDVLDPRDGEDLFSK